MPYDGRLLSGVTVLMAVVEAGSMVRAAEALGLTPSGVGRAIARLETRVGVRLLERTTRTMTLTDEGRRFYEEVGPHLDGIEQAATLASGSAVVVRGRLRVNVDPFFSRVVLAGQIAGFLEKHPEVRIELIMRDHVGDLVAYGFDLALRFGEPQTAWINPPKKEATPVPRDNQKPMFSDNPPMHLMVEHASLGATPVKPEAARGGGLKGQALRA